MPRRLYTFSARITIGAQAFVRDDRLDPRRNVVLNLEARGTSGPALMFQSSSENASVIPALASVQRPITSSGWEACYQVLPGDTDLSVFRNAGFAGMNFAFFDGSARYHTPEDSPTNFDHASLQHMGSTVLATARKFAGQDLGAPRGGSLTYFTVLGELVHYPQSLAVSLAVLAAVVFVATLLYARRRGVRIRGVGLAAASFLALLVVTMALGMGTWQVLRLLNPGYGGDHPRDLGLVSRARYTHRRVRAWGSLPVHLDAAGGLSVPGCRDPLGRGRADVAVSRLECGRRTGHRVVGAAGRLVTLPRTGFRQRSDVHGGPGSGHCPAGAGPSRAPSRLASAGGDSGGGARPRNRRAAHRHLRR